MDGKPVRSVLGKLLGLRRIRAVGGQNRVSVGALLGELLVLEQKGSLYLSQMPLQE
jgi:hypothetical protein